MKLGRVGEVGAERPALLENDRLHDLGRLIPDIGGDVLLPTGLAHLAILDHQTLPLISGSPRIGPEPILFLKPTSSISGPNDSIEIPPGAEKIDWEVELGVVIGKPGEYVPVENALHDIAGYCVVNDVSERSHQLERGGQWDKGKGCDTFAPIGPWLVTRDEVPDPQSLDLWLDVDRERVQTGNTRTMIFGVARLVSYVSQFMSLRSGDVIATGTPPGVGLGQKPPRFLKVGQRLRLGISVLGVQSQRTVSATCV